MQREGQARYLITGVVFLLIIVLMSARLFHLQFTLGEKSLQKAQDFSRKEIRLTGQRGKILDRNGLPLAYNKTSYSVQFVRDPSHNQQEDRVAYTQAMLKSLRIIEDNGGTFLNTFAIRKMDDGSYDFYWPSVDKGTKAYDDRVTKWKSENCGSSKKIYSKDTPEQIFQECRIYYEIPGEVSYDEAFKVLSVWQEIRSTFYSSFLPITLASDVSMKTVALIERDMIELPGMQISQSSTRVYPNKSMAAHVIGYMGRMASEPTIVDMQEQGYRQDDLIGRSGIEQSMELELSGNTSDRTGVKVIEVNNLGKESRVIESDNKQPKNGNNVVLTIDSRMQKVLEEALAENIAQIRSAQEAAYNENKQKYDGFLKDLGRTSGIHYAQVGAAVVMDVQTAQVLAMASYPGYDLNIFNGGMGISDEDFKLIKDDPRNPLFNNAISSRGTPGSVFKMVTGLAGLAEGVIAPETKISDGGYYNKYVKNTADHGPSCWVRPFSEHSDQTIVQAIKNSCNYFFFKVADDLGIQRLNKWADLLGLSSKTGIELPAEVSGQIGSQASLYSKGNMSGVAALVRNQIVTYLRDACRKEGLKYDDNDSIYPQAAIKMMDLVNAGIQNKGPDIRTILKNDLKLKDTFALSNQISASLYEIEWNGNFTIEAGIGQSVTLVTPIAMARYVSAIVNGGDVFQPTIVKATVTPDGQVHAKQPQLIRNLGVPEIYLQKIREGMADVVSEREEGTAAGQFKNYKYKEYIGGKTGTAEVSKTIDLENNSWFVAFAPKDKPEIAVVVYIPSGYQGALSSYTAKAIVQYYLDMKNQVKQPDALPPVNALVK